MITEQINIAKRLSDIYYPLSNDSLHALANILKFQKCKKNEIILHEGEICKSLIFVEKGLLRQFYYKYKKDLTEHISYEDGMVICIESYLEQKPTVLMVESLEQSFVWKINKDEIEYLADKYKDIEVFYRKIFETSLILSQVKADSLRFEPANERYSKLMKLHPQILQRTPLIYVASLLQMTPETLSRVRSSTLID